MAAGTEEDPWVLKTPPGSSEYTMYRDESADPPALVCQVGSPGGGPYWTTGLAAPGEAT